MKDVILKKVYGIKIHTMIDYLCQYLPFLPFPFFNVNYLFVLKIGTVCNSALCYRIRNFLTLYFR